MLLLFFFVFFFFFFFFLETKATAQHSCHMLQVWHFRGELRDTVFSRLKGGWLS